MDAHLNVHDKRQQRPHSIVIYELILKVDQVVCEIRHLMISDLSGEFLKTAKDNLVWFVIKRLDYYVLCTVRTKTSNVHKA